MSDRTVQLKVCEGCGGLFLRPVGDGAYCGGCRQFLAGFPKRRKRVGVLPTVMTVATEPGTDRAAKPDPIVWRVFEGSGARKSLRRLRPEFVVEYRKYTEAMLRRYLQMSMGAGRMPSLLGRELFRGNVSHCTVSDLSDAIAYCVDVERLCLELQPADRDVLGRVALQQYTLGEAAQLMSLSVRQTARRYNAALDKLTCGLLKTGMLEPMGVAA